MKYRTFYHATEKEISRPEPQRNVVMSGTPVPALFANVDPHLTVYGSHLYRFTVKDQIKIMPMSSKIYTAIRTQPVDYRAGVFDMARRFGVDLLYRTHAEGDTSIIVLNFACITDWCRVED